MKPTGIHTICIALICLLSLSGFYVNGQVIIGGDQSQVQPPEKQDRSLKYFNLTSAGVSIGLGSFKTDIYEGIQKKIKNDELVISLQTLNGVKYMDRLGIGVSVGMEHWRDGFFWPVYGYLGYDFGKEENRVYAGVYLGYAFGTRDSTTYFNKGTGAFAMSLTLGYRMKLARSLFLMYELFYKYQALESTYYVHTQVNDTTSITSYDYKVPLHFVGFRIGLSFP